jgi:maleylacetoacetate isomerase
MAIKLYDNSYANAPIRVRAALLLKGIAFDRVVVDFDSVRSRREIAAYQVLNPQALVPTLVDGDFVFGQSLAIIEYLEERYPIPPLLPADPQGRARVRSLALMIACEAQPLVNFRVREFLRLDYALPDAEVLRWVRHWLTESLVHYEKAIANHPATGRFSHGESPTLADVCLFAHVLHAKRFEVPLDAYPTVIRIFRECMAIPAFYEAQPEAVRDCLEPHRRGC